MKKALRCLALSLTVILLAVTLCGCNALDEMRACHALLGENSSIILDGTVYMPLPPCDSFAPNTDNERPLVNLTSPDVPLLLSDTLAMQQLEVCADGDILRDAVAGIYYCRADRYAEVVERINNGPVFAAYGYEYAYWNEEGFTYDVKTYLFTDPQTDAFEQVLFDTTPIMLNPSTVLPEYQMDVWQYSEDMLFKERLCSVVRVVNTYFLFLEVDSTTAAFYLVPDSLSGVFADIIREYLNAEGYENDFDGI